MGKMLILYIINQMEENILMNLKKKDKILSPKNIILFMLLLRQFLWKVLSYFSLELIALKVNTLQQGS